MSTYDALKRAYNEQERRIEIVCADIDRVVENHGAYDQDDIDRSVAVLQETITVLQAQADGLWRALNDHHADELEADAEDAAERMREHRMLYGHRD